jgi:hypothetical protein
MQANELILTIVVVGLVSAIFIYQSHKQKQSSWEGLLFKKRRYEDYESGQTTYTLVFKTDEGKKRRIKIKSKAEFDKWIEGDRAIKTAGEFFPKKA